jgi:hypothetical protein
VPKGGFLCALAVSVSTVVYESRSLFLLRKGRRGEWPGAFGREWKSRIADIFQQSRKLLLSAPAFTPKKRLSARMKKPRRPVEEFC